MKQFLNVLYRRILYKIPLKFLLILLAIFAVCIASVKADYLDGLQYLGNFTINNSDNYTTNLTTLGYTNNEGYACFYVHNIGSYGIIWYFNQIDNSSFKFQGPSPSFTTYDFFCVYYFDKTWNVYIINRDRHYISADIDYYYMPTLNGVQSGNPGYTSLQCQTEYNLIPISSVDQNYCTTNNLCPTCQVCPSGSGSISTLYINDILHVGSPFIYMNIPEEIGWDYAYTQGGTNMFIDVEGYNVDYDKINSIIDVQNYKPTSEDFTQVVSNLTPYIKIMVFVLFIFIIWKWIKGGFKSKLK